MRLIPGILRNANENRAYHNIFYGLLVKHLVYFECTVPQRPPS